MQSVMAHSFAQVPSVDIPRSSFKRPSGHTTAMDCDYLVPIYLDEVLPGDTFNMDCNFFARLATPIHPIMDNVYMEVHWWYVPYRIVWDNWIKFCGAIEDPADVSIEYTIPKVDSNTAYDVITNNNILFHYMGLPWVSSLDCTEISALPFRALNSIWNNWYRDQNLQDSEESRTGDGPDSHLYYRMLKRGKRHDYFTSCLPSPQRGESVALPLGSDGPIYFDGSNNDDIVVADDTSSTVFWKMEKDPSTDQIQADGPYGGITPNLHTNLADATASTISDLRLAFALQRMLERDMRSGTRYPETIKAHFGVTFPDQPYRPEFLGGGQARVNITPVAQTNFNGDVGRLGGFGTTGGRNGFTKSFVEFGIVIGLANIRADIRYQQGMERFWTRDTRYDFFYPVFSGLSEMPVLNREIYYQNTSADEDVFGYQESYADYRYKPSRISSVMSSQHATSLDPWHLAEEFTSLPTLGNTFIQSNTGAPMDRAIAVPSEPHFIADFYFDLKCARPMPMYGVPGLLDHF